jgi:hypothetical protein
MTFSAPTGSHPAQLRRTDKLGGLIHEYQAAGDVTWMTVSAPQRLESRRDRQRRDPRSRLHSEPPAWPPRAWGGCAAGLTVAAVFGELALAI